MRRGASFVFIRRRSPKNERESSALRSVPKQTRVSLKSPLINNRAELLTGHMDPGWASWGGVGGGRLQLSSVLRSMEGESLGFRGSGIVVVADLRQSVFQAGRDFVRNICFSFSKIPGARRGHASGPFVSVSRAGRIQFRHVA